MRSRCSISISNPDVIARRAVAATLVALGCATFAACGSSSKGATKAEFVAQADATCERYTAVAKEVTANLTNPTPAQTAAAIKTRLAPLFERQVAELRTLKAPAADQATVNKFFDDLQAATADIARDPKGFLAAHGATPLAKKAAADAQAYGFQVCARLTTG